MPLHIAAQQIQRSAYPTAYARWELQGKQLVDYFNEESKGGTELVEEEVEVEEVQVVKKSAYLGIDREKVFSTFKVNREIFNFFLRGEQFSIQKYKYTRSKQNTDYYGKMGIDRRTLG